MYIAEWSPKKEDNARLNRDKLMCTGATKIMLLAGISWSHAHPPLWMRILRSLALTTAVLIIFLSNHLVTFGPSQAEQSERSRERKKRVIGDEVQLVGEISLRDLPLPLLPMQECRLIAFGALLCGRPSLSLQGQGRWDWQRTGPPYLRDTGNRQIGQPNWTELISESESVLYRVFQCYRINTLIQKK